MKNRIAYSQQGLMSYLTLHSFDAVFFAVILVLGTSRTILAFPVNDVNVVEALVSMDKELKLLTNWDEGAWDTPPANPQPAGSLKFNQQWARVKVFEQEAMDALRQLNASGSYNSSLKLAYEKKKELAAKAHALVQAKQERYFEIISVDRPLLIQYLATKAAGPANTVIDQLVRKTAKQVLNAVRFFAGRGIYGAIIAGVAQGVIDDFINTEASAAEVVKCGWYYRPGGQESIYSKANLQFQKILEDLSGTMLASDILNDNSEHLEKMEIASLRSEVSKRCGLQLADALLARYNGYCPVDRGMTQIPAGPAANALCNYNYGTPTLGVNGPHEESYQISAVTDPYVGLRYDLSRGQVIKCEFNCSVPRGTGIYAGPHLPHLSLKWVSTHSPSENNSSCDRLEKTSVTKQIVVDYTFYCRTPWGTRASCAFPGSRGETPGEFCYEQRDTFEDVCNDSSGDFSGTIPFKIYYCKQNPITPCGEENLRCCDQDPKCAEGLVCGNIQGVSTNLCVACGGYGQPCCDNSVCNGGFAACNPATNRCEPAF